MVYYMFVFVYNIVHQNNLQRQQQQQNKITKKNNKITSV